MEKVNMNYSFYSQEEPTDEQLRQLMHEACQDAMEKKRIAEKAYFDRLRASSKAAKEAFKKEHR